MSWLGTLTRLIGTGLGAITGVGDKLLPYANLAYQKHKDAHLTGAQREANQFSAQQAEIARDWQEHMYNQYESPQARIRQYEEAGLNPALMYGDATGGNMPSASAPASVSSQGGDINGAIAQLIGLKRSIAEIDNLNAQSQLYRGQYEKTLSDIGLNAKNIEKIDGELKYMASQESLIAKQIEKLGSDISVAEAQKSLMALQGVLASAEARNLNAQSIYHEWRGKIIENEQIDPQNLSAEWRFAIAVVENLFPEGGISHQIRSFFSGIKEDRLNYK